MKASRNANYSAQVFTYNDNYDTLRFASGTVIGTF